MKKIILFCVLYMSISVFAQTKILFLGNSFTSYNNLPSLFNGIANAAGISVTIDSRTKPGMAVATEQMIGHYADATSQAKINSQNWDYIVVQDNQGNYAGSTGSIPSLAVTANATLYSQIKINDSCTRIIYFAGWGPSGGVSTGDNTTACINRIYSNMLLLNNSIADEIVSPVGKAWITCMSQLPSEDLYYSDNVHPSLEGSYMAAVTLFTTIFKKDLTTINYTAGLNSASAQTMRTIAYTTITNSAIYTASQLNMYTPTITTSGSILTCNGNNYTSYQWYNNGNPVGTNSNSYTATSNGTYSVVVTTNSGCEMSSFEINLTTVDIASPNNELSKLIIHSLYNNLFDIVSEELGILSIFDTQGKLVYTTNKISPKITIDLNEKAKGLYSVILVNSNKRLTQKFCIR